MKFTFVENSEFQSVINVASDCFVVGVHERTIHGLAETLDTLCRGALSEALDCGDLLDKVGSTVMLYSSGAIQVRRILLVQLGSADKLDNKRAHQAAVAAGNALKVARCKSVAWGLTDQSETCDMVSQSVLALHEVNYRFDSLKTQPDLQMTDICEVALMIAPAHLGAAGESMKRATAIAGGVSLCRDLGNLPPNICTPEYLAKAAQDLANSACVEVEVIEREEIQALKMNAFLSVAKGSKEAPKLIVIRYCAGPSDQAPIVLVGKGITFDSGGISIKPGEAMDEMKYDMCGAAAVVGTLKAVIEMKLPLNIYGVVPACENMPAGDALKPGDIITSMLGKTIEVLNTDAEGRLILCDALTYVERFEPRAVIDVATLTGSCVMALGDVHSGLFAREQHLADELLAAAKASSDTVWQMPLDDVYQEGLKSNFADFQNIGGRPAGSITAACFLENFTRKYSWAHLDIAGTAWKSGSNKGATGRPVKLLTQYLVSCSDLPA